MTRQQTIDYLNTNNIQDLIIAYVFYRKKIQINPTQLMIIQSNKYMLDYMVNWLQDHFKIRKLYKDNKVLMFI